MNHMEYRDQVFRINNIHTKVLIPDYKNLKRQLPKGIFLSGNFPNVQFSKGQLPKYVLAAALGPIAACIAPEGLT